MPGLKIKISKWYERFGNNMLQLANACCYSVLNNAYFQSPQHEFVDIFTINNYIKYSYTIEESFFYNYEKYDKIRHEYVKKYIRPNLINIPEYDPINNDTVIIHIRSGDVFTKEPHSKYIQNPLSYFQKIIKNYEKTIVVCEDSNNPVINEFKKNSNIQVKFLSLQETIAMMLAAQNIVFSGVGTFGPICAMLSNNLKKIYMTNISNIDNQWFFDTSINIEHTNISLCKYISPNTWKNSAEQRELMIKYHE
jgi:hypothetical protein